MKQTQPKKKDLDAPSTPMKKPAAMIVSPRVSPMRPSERFYRYPNNDDLVCHVATFR